MILYTVRLPENLYRQLKRQAEAEHRSLDDYVQQTLTRQLPSPVPVEDDLPPLLKSELLAMEQLSDTALWALARSVLTDGQLAEMDRLRDVQEVRPLTPQEELSKEALLRDYQETVLRRAHAAVLLQSRGYDMSDPSVL
jgi:hypothetical protein